MRKGTTAATWVRGVVDAFAAEGLDVGSLLAEAGIDPASLKAPAGRVPTEQISRLWELAAKQSGNEAIGLLQHQVARPASFDVVGYTMMSCANLLEAFERLIRYLLILSDALTMILSEERGGYRVTFELFGGKSAGSETARRIYPGFGHQILPVDQRTRVPSVGCRLGLPDARGFGALPRGVWLPGGV